jgi:hypothetical protein
MDGAVQEVGMLQEARQVPPAEGRGEHGCVIIEPGMLLDQSPQAGKKITLSKKAPMSNADSTIEAQATTSAERMG